MTDQRYDAMVRAVDLARSGQFNNWWAIAARLRIKRYQQDALDWTEHQRQWLDRLCIEAKGAPPVTHDCASFLRGPPGRR